MLTIANALEYNTDDGGEGVLKFCIQNHFFKWIVVV